MLNSYKSKLISGVRDVFSCSVANSNALKRENITINNGIASIPSDCFGHIRLLAI